AGLVEKRTAGGVEPLDVGKVEPLAPAFPVADMQERESPEICWRAQRLAAVEQLRTVHRKQLLRAQARDVQTGGRSVTVANGEIDVLAREVDVMHGCAHPEIDLGLSLGEATEPVDEPF